MSGSIRHRHSEFHACVEDSLNQYYCKLPGRMKIWEKVYNIGNYYFISACTAGERDDLYYEA